MCKEKTKFRTSSIFLQTRIKQGDINFGTPCNRQAGVSFQAHMTLLRQYQHLNKQNCIHVGSCHSPLIFFYFVFIIAPHHRCYLIKIRRGLSPYGLAAEAPVKPQHKHTRRGQKRSQNVVRYYPRIFGTSYRVSQN